MISARRYSSRSRMLALAALGLCAMPAVASADVSGSVFQDFNGNGVRDTGGQAAVDTPVAGVTVTATDGQKIVGTASTKADGSWAIAVSDDVKLRIDVEPPSGWWPARAGVGSAPITSFLTSPQADVETGIQVPGRHCSDNPLIATPCYVTGPSPASGGNSERINDDPALVGLPWQTPDGSDAPDVDDKVILATWGEIGATYGVAANPATGDYYAGAYIKRHTGLRDGTGSIFRVPRNDANDGWNAPQKWIDIPNTGANPHTDSDNLNPWVFDSVEAFDAVGKRGLGDIDISPSGDQLYAVNLNTRALHVVSTDDGSAISTMPIPSPEGYPASDWRPFGLGVDPDNGSVYVGGVVSGESTLGVNGKRFGNRDGLALAVFRFDPTAGTFDATPVLLHTDLTFDRKCVRQARNNSVHDINNPDNCGDDDDATWNPWISAAEFEGIQHSNHPQPMLSDISFQNGEMVLGIRDRIGDQLGNAAWGPQWDNGNDDTELYQGQPAGAVYRAFPSGGTFTLEENAGNPFAVTPFFTGGKNSGEGPGGGSWIYGDDHFYHDHTSLGSAATVPGFNEIATTSVNPFEPKKETYDGGFRFYSGSGDDAGRRTRAVRLYNGTNRNPDLLGKANGLGDLAPFCPIADVQIGNRIWFDNNNDGIQDGNEPSIPDLKVKLFLGDQEVGDTVTDDDGHWYFDSTNVPGGLIPGEEYMVVVPDQNPLNGYELTKKDQGNDDELDSDAMKVDDASKITLRVGGPGENNHSYDIGFVLPSTPDPDPEPEPETPPTATPPPTPTPTPAPTPAPAPETPEAAPPTPVEEPAARKPVGTRLTLSKISLTPEITAGEQAIWDVRVANIGKVTAKNVVVSDIIPRGMVMQRSARMVQNARGKLVAKRIAFRVVNGRVVWNLGDLKAGKKVRLRVWMKANKSARGTRINRVTVKAKNAAGRKDSANVRLIASQVAGVVLPAVTG